jgi:hypothetical protein
MNKTFFLLVVFVLLSNWPIAAQEPARSTAVAEKKASGGPEQIDFERVRSLLRKSQGGEKLTDEEAAYLARAQAARAEGKAGNNAGDKAGKAPDRNQPPQGGKDSIGQKPLTEMLANDRYKDQDGGLYGHGRNEPPQEHRQAAENALAKITPLNAAGQPASEGTIGFVSISMSNATQEFSTFKRIADADPGKSHQVTIVDCAQGGQAMAEWVDPQGGPWQEAARRVAAAKLAPPQIQVAWIKLANKGPRGNLSEHGSKLEKDTIAVIQNAKAKFPNLQVAYLSSRIYGGFSTGPLNPEPYAYESGFVARWVIQRQISGDSSLNYDRARGDVRAAVLVWGPYLWADGTTPRKADGLSYRRDDLGPDGTHPSNAGREKVAKFMLEFYKTDPLAKSWFAR